MEEYLQNLAVSHPVACVLGGGIVIVLLLMGIHMVTVDKSSPHALSMSKWLLISLGMMCGFGILLALTQVAAYVACVLILCVAAPVYLIWWLGEAAVMFFKKIFFIAGLLTLILTMIIGSICFYDHDYSPKIVASLIGMSALTALLWWLHHKADFLYKHTVMFLKQFRAEFAEQRKPASCLKKNELNE